MFTAKLQQLQYESQTWKSSIDYMIEGNIRMKNRISEILKGSFDKNLLDELDEFQNRLIKADELACLLKSDLAQIDRMTTKETIQDKNYSSEIYKMLSKLRKNIKTTEGQLSTLKSEFNAFLSENI